MVSADEISVKEEKFDKPTKKGDKKQSKETKSEQKTKTVVGKMTFSAIIVPVNVPEDKLCIIKELKKIEHIDNFKGKDSEGNTFLRQMKRVIFSGIVDGNQHLYQIMLTMKNFSKFVELGTQAESVGKSICILPKELDSEGKAKFSPRIFQIVEDSQESEE